MMLTRLIEKFLFKRIQGVLSGSPARALDQIPRSRSYPETLRERPVDIRKAIEKNPGDPVLWVSLGYALLNIEFVDAGIESFEKALALDPHCQPAVVGLAAGAAARGRADQAMALYRQALDMVPGDVTTFQNILFLTLCSDTSSEEEILDGHKRFAERFESPLRADWREHPNSPEPERVLRIGYVSPDLRGHVVGRCIAPVIKNHDRAAFSVTCYYNSDTEDDVTAAIRSNCDDWLNIRDLDDTQFCEQIRRDRIDILVDLSGHTPGNRLLAFARKPSPVQVSYLDYSATTGLSSIDYRLTDGLCDPAPVADAYYTETLCRLPTTYWLYKPDALHGGNVLPAGDDGRVVFSCLNSFYRVTDRAFQVWAEILRRLPSARLVLIGVPPGSARDRVLARFNSMGVGGDRLEMFGLLAYEHYIDLVRATDIALAPFPYNGAMTLLDCLWNGVPVITLEGGKTFHSRMGNSILTTLGLDGLIARDLADYVDIALKVAGRRRWRNDLRMTLRGRIRDSVLYQEANFTRAVENAYRQMWRTYCQTRKAQDVVRNATDLS